MLKRTERISFRIYFVLSKVEPEPGAGPSHRLRPKSTDFDRLRLHNTGHTVHFFGNNYVLEIYFNCQPSSDIFYFQSLTFYLKNFLFKLYSTKGTELIWCWSRRPGAAPVCSGSSQTGRLRIYNTGKQTKESDKNNGKSRLPGNITPLQHLPSFWNRKAQWNVRWWGREG